MGRKKIISTLSLILVIFYVSNSFSQTKIKGIIVDENKTPLVAVSVVLQDSLQNIVNYTYTNSKGFYELPVRKTGVYSLSLSSLGFQNKILPIQITTLQKKYALNAVLKEKAFELNEVIIQADKPITVGKDTIRFKTKYFAKGNEQTVEQLLKTIPGLNIDTEGTIKVGNQEIEKLMVDGDDLFEKGYKILSKNMPAYPIKEVEVLKNYSNNRLLKGIENSKKVALNLKLNEKAKRVWFGNTELGYGLASENYYEAKGNLMNFGKKNKYYFLANANNIGYDATGDVEQLVRPFRMNEPASIGDNQQVQSILGLSASNLAFKKERSNFNNAELLSLNAIFNVTDKLKLKTLGFFNWDEKNSYKNSISTVNTNDINFTNTENLKVRKKQKTAFGKFDVIYNGAKNKMLEATTKFNYSNFDDTSDLVFNSKSTLENLASKNTLFDQKINYTQKFQQTKALLLTGRYIFEEAPQNYKYNQFLFEDVFPADANANNVTQNNNNKMQFIGVNAHLLDKKGNGNLLELQIGNEFRKDNLQTKFSLLEDTNTINSPAEYQNNTNYTVNDLYAKAKFIYKLNDFKIISKLSAHQLFNSLKNNEVKRNQNPFFVNPSLGFGWKINRKNKISTSYSYNTNNASVLDVYDNAVLTGFRSFTKGTNDFNQLTASNLVFNYQLGNWSDRFFANTFIMYTKNHDFFSTNTNLNQNFTQSEKILIKDREFLSINTKLDYYFKAISSNLKLDLGYAKTEFKNIINNSDLRTITSNNYNYGAELRSGFSGIFNYHLGTKWTTNTIKTPFKNSFTNTVSFLDISLIFNDNFDVNLESERYFFGNLENDKSYYFLDFNARYKIIKDKLTLGITGKNLFNTKQFKTSSISDIGSSTTEYRLLPRYALFKLEYRF